MIRQRVYLQWLVTGMFTLAGMLSAQKAPAYPRYSREVLEITFDEWIGEEEFQELQASLQRMAINHNKTLLSRFDKNKDGKLDAAERRAMHNTITSERAQFYREWEAKMQGQNGEMELPPQPPEGGWGGGWGGHRGGEWHGHRGEGEVRTGRRSNAHPEGSALLLVDGGQETAKRSLVDQVLDSKEQDQSAVRVVSGGKLQLKNLTVTKSGDTSSEEASNFTGLNSAISARKNSSLIVEKGSLTTRGNGANAVFAFGRGAVVQTSDLTIETVSDSSRGLVASFGGAIYAENLNIHTHGARCTALATDRGEGTIRAAKVIARTEGKDSPGIYSTGDIRAVDSTFVSEKAEAAIVEGRSSILLENCKLTGSKKRGVFLYRIFSEEEEYGRGSFTMKGGELTAQEGPLFFASNTFGEVNLTGVTLKGASHILAQAAISHWGTRGENGGHLRLIAQKQILAGKVMAGAHSTVTLKLNDGAKWKGSVPKHAGTVQILLGTGAVWNVTADSIVDTLDGENMTKEQLLAAIHSHGKVISYGYSSILKEETIRLPDGGTLQPLKEEP
ncbi:MAG: hypothetical protein IJJ26_05090 [Victivallales bacterium]|nr:hypothetical protein [Victivallales bacterium]